MPIITPIAPVAPDGAGAAPSRTLAPSPGKANLEAAKRLVQGLQPRVVEDTPKPAAPAQSLASKLDAAMGATPAAEPEARQKLEGREEGANPSAEVTASKDEPLSPKFAALARKEKELRRMQEEIATEKSAIKAKASEYESAYVSKTKLAADPLGALGELGITYDKIVELALAHNGSSDPAVKALRAEIDALKASQTQTLSQFEQREKDQYDRALNQIRSEATDLVGTDARFETVKALDRHDAVVDRIEKHFKETGLVLSTETAAQQEEDHLLDEAVKVAQLKSVQARLSPKVESSAEPDQKLAPQTQQSQTSHIKTLTNAATTAPGRALTERERRLRAIAAARGELT